MNEIRINISPVPWYAKLHRLLFRKFWQIRLNLPQNWDEVTADQLQKIASLITTGRSMANDLLLLQVLSGFHRFQLSMIPTEIILEIIELNSWLYITPREIPVIEHFYLNGQCYHLPAARLQTASAIEFAMADQFLQKFTGEDPENALNKLVATLCRPAQKELDKMNPDWNGDIREKYSEAVMTARADHFQNLSLGLKISVLHFFLGCKKHITEKYALIFDQEDEGNAPSTGPNFGLIGVFFDLADKGTFGNFEETAHTNLHTILVYLVKQKIAEIQRAMSKQK